MSEETLDEAEVDGDRDIPSVAQSNSRSILPMLLFGGIAVVGAGLILTQESSNNAPPSFVAPDDEQFRINRNSAGTPAVTPVLSEPTVTGQLNPQVEPVREVQRAPQPVDPAIQARAAQLREEAIQRARAQQQRLDERKRSGQLVFTGGNGSPLSSANGSTGARLQQIALRNGQGSPALSDGVITPDQLRATIGPQNRPSTGTPLGGISLGGLSAPGDAGNDNQAFANANANQTFETAVASQLTNLESLVPQGTLISGILETAIQSDLPGQVRAIVSEDIYAFDQSDVMIPTGSRLIGQYRAGVTQGQTRVFVIWDRLIRPDGVTVQVGSFGTDQLGRSGLDGQIDTHFFKRFGSSILLTLIEGGIQAGVAAIDDDDAAGIALDGGQNFSRAAELALENSINIPPTIHVDQGKRIKVFVGRDLDFSQVE